MLRARGVAISMDGKGRYLDNIFVERLWRSLKYEEIYLHVYDSPSEARAGVGRYFDFYNCRRPHQALGYQTPDAFHRGVRRAPARAASPPATPSPATRKSKPPQRDLTGVAALPT